MFKRKHTSRQQRIPTGIIKASNDKYAVPPVSSLYVRGIGDFATAPHETQRDYEVNPKHDFLSCGGVKFNVETVTTATDVDRNKRAIGREEFLSSIKKEASEIYEDKKSAFGEKDTPMNVRLEAASKCPENLVFAGSQGFFAACLSAFAQHLPLAISPDHVWALISFAFAQHVNKHAEELRSNFVQHEGKKRLLVEADHMVLSGGASPDSGSSPETWEQTIFSDFSKQIRENIGDKIHSAIAGTFSTTDAVSSAAHEITLMSAMKNYFSYGMSTCCGIPTITLLGSEEDWTALRERAENLANLMTPAFSSFWMPLLLPVLDEFVRSYKGQVNHGFWQSMVKLRASSGSGARSVVSGWLQILYPYLKGGRLNNSLRPWQHMYFQGPEPDEIPAILSSAPVDWNYYGTTYHLHFSAGFVGCTQDPIDGALTPAMGWYVSHDPPSHPKERLKVIKEEISSLVKCHHSKNEAAIDKTEPWFRRVCILFCEQKVIYESLLKNLQEKEEQICKQRTWMSEDKLETKIHDLKNEKEQLLESAVPSCDLPEDAILHYM